MVIIDAYNLLHWTHLLPDPHADTDLDGVLTLLSISRYATDQILLVCDGAGAPTRWAKGTRRERAGPTPGIRIIYAGHGTEADAAIESILAERPPVSKEGRATLVISSDKRVQAAARRHEFDYRASEDFLRQLAEDARRRDEAGASSNQPASKEPRRTGLDADEARIWATHMRAETPEVGDLIAQADAAMRVLREEAAREAAKRGGAAKSKPETPKKPAAKPPQPPAPPPAPTNPGDDPTLRALLKDYGQAINPADLDMQQWLNKPPT